MLLYVFVVSLLCRADGLRGHVSNDVTRGHTDDDLTHGQTDNSHGLTDTKSTNTQYKNLLTDIFGEDFEPPSREKHSKPVTPVAVSRYMNRLFERYRTNPDFTSTDRKIVRSILPQKDGDGKSVDFALTSLRKNENVTKARLHVRHRLWKRRKGIEHFRKTKFLVFLVRPNGHLSQLKPVGSSFHWLIFNLDNPVREASAHSRMLSLAFAKQKGGKTRFVQTTKAVSRHSPFLVVHSEKTKPGPDGFGLGRDRVGQTSGFGFKKGGWNAMHRKGSRRRFKRDITADSPRGYFSYNLGDANTQSPHAEKVEDNLRQLGPKAVLQSWKDMRRQNARKNLALNGNSSPKTLKSGPQKVVEYVPFSPEKMNPKIVLLNNYGIPKPKACGKRSLKVNFADLGWDNWIIAPTSFEPNYCDGSCSATPGEHSPLRQTNHAIIQNIIFNLGQHPHVPTPCCAPDRLDSLSLLYYNEENNIVLQNYPKMTVESCACL